jgi:hypothetical protein
MGKVNASIYKVALLFGVLLAYVVVNDVHWDMNASIHTPQVSAGVEVQIDSTPGHNIFNPTAPIDNTDHITVTPKSETCTTDTDCVTRFPEIIPDANTVDDYWRVWGDTPHFPTTGDCSRVDWLAQDENGRPLVPVDLNGNGAIDCNSDLELGA